jgi:hypothetical protein
MSNEYDLLNEPVYGEKEAVYESLLDMPFTIEDEYITEAKELSYGIFWIISDYHDLSNHKLLFFDVPCTPDGVPSDIPSIAFNAKSSDTYNHKKIWDTEIKGNSIHKPYNKKEYNYYPRGRIVISNNKADIYLNPHINKPDFIREIKLKFGLTPNNISKTREINDNSAHYQCFLDWE